MDPTDNLMLLRHDIRQLESVLLPEPITEQSIEDDPLAAEPDEHDSLRIRAFLILAHAGIEEALEEAISIAVTSAMEEPGVAAPAVSLSLTAKYSDDLIGQNDGRVPSASWILERLPGLYKAKVIKPNNGIRRKSIMAMCKPLGIDVSDLNTDASSAIAALETLGAKRGAAAHTLRGAAQETVHAADARQWVGDALDGLSVLIPLLQKMITAREVLAHNGVEFE